MSKTNHIYLGTAAAVVKVSKDKGEIKWRTVLSPESFWSSGRGHTFVSLLVEDQRVFVHTVSELFCLDSDSGEILWRNPLSGLGNQLGTLASDHGSSCPNQIEQAQQDSARD